MTLIPKQEASIHRAAQPQPLAQLQPPHRTKPEAAAEASAGATGSRRAPPHHRRRCAWQFLRRRSERHCSARLRSAGIHGLNVGAPLKNF
jgi:hypothetical protein